MYAAHFGLREKPFSVSPNPRFFYSNPAYNEAYASLVYAIKSRMGFAVLTGEAGTGKTTVLRRLMDNLGSQVSFVFFYNTNLTFDELLGFACDELRIQVAGGRLEKIQALNEFLLKELERGSTAALLIDEAQNLKPGVLEELRLLSNLETGTEKLLQIVLVGQPELELLLDRPELRQLKQRVAVHRQLDRLKPREVADYVDHRLRAVGSQRRDLFADEAIRLAAIYSRGIPRLVNVLCDNALLIAFGLGKKRISAEMVEEAARDLRLLHELTTEDSSPARQLTALERTRALPRSFSHGAGWWAATVALFLLGTVLLAAGGAAALSSQGHDPFGDLGRRVEDVLAPVRALFTGNGGGAVVAAPAADVAPLPEVAMLVDEPTPLPTPIPTPVSAPAPEPPAVPTVSERSSAERFSIGSATEAVARRKSSQHVERPSAEPLASARPVPIPVPKWPQEPIVVPEGVTVPEIVRSQYGAQSDLGMDLVVEGNRRILDVSRVQPGESLTLPPLDRETLVRAEQDGTYSIVLDAFDRYADARELADRVALEGYLTITKPRRISDTDLLYRVEIRGLGSRADAQQAWETARSKRWLAAARQGRGSER